MTAEPTNLAILHAGGKVVWADVDPRAMATCARKSAGESHYTAHAGDSGRALRRYSQSTSRRFANWESRHGIAIIEDAAHALGARYNGELIGSAGDFVMFSLQAIKHITTVDGGLLACARQEDCDRGRLIRWFGLDRHADRNQSDVKEVGFKYHMNNVNATMGSCQLPHIPWVVERHIENGRYFDENLRGVPGLRALRVGCGRIALLLVLHRAGRAARTS